MFNLDPEPVRFAHALYRLWRVRMWRKRKVQQAVANAFSLQFSDHERFLRAAEASKPVPSQRRKKWSTVLGCSTTMTDAEIDLFVYQQAMQVKQHRCQYHPSRAELCDGTPIEKVLRRVG